MKKLLVIIFLSFLSSKGYSQDYGNNADALKLCSAIQSNNFGTDSMAEDALDKILSTIGASKRFVLQPCDNINNAIATSYRGVRYILYDRDFMYSLNRGNNWGNLFILAHEVGHHINGHSLDLVLYASEAVEPKTLEQRRQQELEADEFAGFILAKLGGNISAANQVISRISSSKDDSYSSHPSRNKRLNAVKKGYNKINQKTYNSKEDIALEYLYRGIEKVNKNNKKGAIADFTTAIELDPNNAEIYYNRGMLYAYEDDYAAISDFSKAIKLNPNEVYGSYYWNRGVSKLNLDDNKGALSDLSKAISGNSKGVVMDFIYRCRAAAKYGLKDYYGAIADLTISIDFVNPNESESIVEKLIFRAACKRKVEDNLGAISDYTKAIKLIPNKADIYANRGISKEILGDLTGACLDWKEAAKLGDNKAAKWVKNQCN